LVQSPRIVHVPLPPVVTQAPVPQWGQSIQPSAGAGVQTIGFTGRMTSVEIPPSIACALPSLVVLDITNGIGRELRRADADQGIAYITAGAEGLVRVNERESGFFTDLEGLLGRLVPLDVPGR